MGWLQPNQDSYYGYFVPIKLMSVDENVVFNPISKPSSVNSLM